MFNEDINFENLEVLEEANVENAEQHDRFQVITGKAVSSGFTLQTTFYVLCFWSNDCDCLVL